MRERREEEEEARLLAEIAASETYVADAARHAADAASMRGRAAEWHRQVFPALGDCEWEPPHSAGVCNQL
jgi:hypothetical protein